MSENKKPEAPKNEKEDAELSELLDSALQDFLDKPGSSEKDKTALEVKKDAGDATEAPEEWNEEFIKQATEQFESNLANLLGTSEDGQPLNPEQVQQKLQQMAEAAQQVILNPGEINETTTDFASTITQAIKGINQGTEGVQNPVNEQELLNMFAGGSGAEGNAFLPFMQGMMQSLLSKDVLYPSLKDILDRFPEWLEKNKDTISAEDKTRYENQQKLMEEICGILEAEKETDSVEEKKVRFEKVLESMQKLQDYGQPPTDLVGDVGPPLPDLSGGLMGDPNQCNPM